ncbi:MAG: SIMPL domain-containing protein [Robiginitomaculum sp.]
MKKYLCLLVSACVLTACSPKTELNEDTIKTLAVTGVGEIEIMPDQFVISGAVITQKVSQDGEIDEEGFEPIAISVMGTGRVKAVRDNSHNRNRKNRLERGQKTTMKFRAPKRRMAQKICKVTHIEASLSFTARVNPADKAGDIITAFTETGVGKVDLLGYDFSAYDALYKQAGEKAVRNAKQKGDLRPWSRLLMTK